MLKVFKYQILFLTAVLAFCLGQDGMAAEDDSQRLVSPELLKHAGLKVLWEQYLPTRAGESLEKMLVFNEHLYAISDKSFMLCLQRDNGRRIFGKTVALSGLRVENLSLFGNKLVSAAGTRLYEIDPNTGIGHSTVELSFGIVCPAARNSKFYYLSGADRRVHTLRVEDKVEVFNVAADNDSLITSILATETFVIFGTDQGNIMSMLPNLPVRLWQFNVGGAIAGQIVLDGISLYFASEDTNVYRVDMAGEPARRRLVWKYQVDGKLKTSPRVTKGVIYQSVYQKDLTAIDKVNGTILWSVPGGVELLAEAGSKAYVMTKDQMLVVMDNKTRKKLYSVNCAGVTKYAANVLDSKIYLADRSGRIACVQPVD